MLQKIRRLLKNIISHIINSILRFVIHKKDILPHSIAIYPYFSLENLVPFIYHLAKNKWSVSLFLSQKLYQQYTLYAHIFSDVPDIKIYHSRQITYYYAHLYHHYIISDTEKTFPLQSHNCLINVWHAAGFFKHFALDYFSSHQINWSTQIRYFFLKRYKHWDYIICSSLASRNIYAKTFQITLPRVLDLGYPRLDWFYSKKNFISQIDKQNLEILHKNFILYAPTFRSHQKNNVHIQQLLDNFPFDDFHKRFPQHHLVLQLHDVLLKSCLSLPILKDYQEKYPFFSLFQNDWPRILFLHHAQCLITDYSSLCMDFWALNKVSLFYPFDKESYQHMERRFYFSYHDFLNPFVANSPESLIEKINTTLYNAKEYQDKIKKYQNLFFNWPIQSFSEQFINYFQKSSETM